MKEKVFVFFADGTPKKLTTFLPTPTPRIFDFAIQTPTPTPQVFDFELQFQLQLHGVGVGIGVWSPVQFTNKDNSKTILHSSDFHHGNEWIQEMNGNNNKYLN